MSRTVLAALAAALLCLPAFGQGVLVTLTDGTEIRGELDGYGAGRYRIRLGGGVVREIDERKIKAITLTDPAGDPRSKDTSASEDARAAFDRGDYPSTLAHVLRALKTLDARRGELNALAARAAEATLDAPLNRRDADGLADALRRTWPSLPEGGRAALLTRLGARFSNRVRTSPDDPFTLALADMLARLAEEGTLTTAFRKTLADHFTAMAQAAAARREAGSAARLYAGALKLDPDRRAAVKAPMKAALLTHAKLQTAAGNASAAAEAARQALELDPEDDDAKRLFETADFARVKQEASAAFPAEAAALFKDFLARARRAEHREWAEKSLRELDARAQTAMPSVTAQIRTYYPVRPGITRLYRRADGERKERITINSVSRERNVLNVYHTLDEIYRDYTTSKTYLVEISKNAVVLTAGGERETLLRFPLREGETWTWRAGSREFRRTVRSVRERVTIGRGDSRRTFENCLVIDFTSTAPRNGERSSITSTSTYAPNVGLVRLEFRNEAFRKFNLELIEGAE